MTAPQPTLLVATFGRLLRYEPAGARAEVVHEGEGKYYGLVPALDQGPAGGRVGVVSRPSEKEDADRTDHLLEIETRSGAVARRRPLASLDTHQMVRAGDRLFVTDPERGEVVEHEWPSLRVLRRIGGFTRENHVNSLHVESGSGSLLVVCHNKGASWMARVDLASGRITERFEDLGEHAHDVEPWRDVYLVCDSKGGALLAVDRHSKKARALWRDAGHFTKGLVAEHGVAYFAVSKAAARAERKTIACDLVALDLVREEPLWRRTIDSRGLVNAIATEASLERQRSAPAVHP